LCVLCLGGVCEEIDAGWDTRRRMYVLWVGDVCEEIELGVPRVRLYGFRVVWRSGRGEEGCM